MTNIDIGNLGNLQVKMIQYIELFSRLQQIKVKNYFVRKKLDQIFKQRVEFQNFVKESIKHSLKLGINAEDLIEFAKYCEDGNVDNKELLGYLKPLLTDTKLNMKESTKLKEQVTNIKNCLDRIINEINDHNVKITTRRQHLPDEIDRANQITDGAISFIKGGATTFGVGAVAAISAAPFTGGASLVTVGIATALGG